MKFIPYTDSLESEWRQFVDAHPDRSIGHLPAMAAFERLASNARNCSFVVRDEADKLVGVVPLFMTEQRELRAFRTLVLSSGNHVPSGPLLAPSFSVRQKAALTELVATELAEIAHRRRADVISIAYPTVISGKPAVESLGMYPLRSFGFRESNVVALVADLSQSEPRLLASLDSKARNLINRCRSGGAETRRLRSRAEWMGCLELNRATLGAGAYSDAAIAGIWDLFLDPGHAAAIGVYFEGRLASVVAVTLVGAASYYWLSFNSVPAPVPGANSLALWEAMVTAQRAGVTTFELGSLEFDDPKQIRIGKFKAQFGGRPVYTLAGSRQVRPLRRAALDLLSHVATAARNKGRRRSSGDDAGKEGA